MSNGVILLLSYFLQRNAHGELQQQPQKMVGTSMQLRPETILCLDI